MKNMDEFVQEAKRIRQAAKQSEFWRLNIEALIESNNGLFEGPISYDDMEACYTYVLDQYDPELLIREDLLKPDQYDEYLRTYRDSNPFFPLIELDENRKIKNVVLWETADCEMVGDFLSRRYKWRDEVK